MSCKNRYFFVVFMLTDRSCDVFYIQRDAIDSPESFTVDDMIDLVIIRRELSSLQAHGNIFCIMQQLEV